VGILESTLDSKCLPTSFLYEAEWEDVPEKEIGMPA